MSEAQDQAGSHESGHFEHDHVGKLVRMANQIATFFESQREDVRIPGIADHIRLFWEKKMRRDIYQHLDQGGEGLKPIVITALEQLRANEKTKLV